jgi:hypothetical protein
VKCDTFATYNLVLSITTAVMLMVVVVVVAVVMVIKLSIVNGIYTMHLFFLRRRLVFPPSCPSNILLLVDI